MCATQVGSGGHAAAWSTTAVVGDKRRQGQGAACAAAAPTKKVLPSKEYFIGQTNLVLTCLQE